MKALNVFAGARNGVGSDLSKIKANADGSDADVKALTMDFGLAYRRNQAASTIAAFADPAGALTLFEGKAKAVDAAAVVVYGKALKSAEDLLLPTDSAIAYARKRALEFHEAEMELLYMANPYATAEGMIGLATGAKRRDALGKKTAAEVQAAVNPLG